MNISWFRSIVQYALGLVLSLAAGYPSQSCSPVIDGYEPLRRGEFWMKTSYQPEEVRVISGWRWHLEKFQGRQQFPLVAMISPKGNALMLVPPLEIKEGGYWLVVVRPKICDPKLVQLCNRRWYPTNRLRLVTIRPEPVPDISPGLPSNWEFLELSIQKGMLNVGSNIFVSPARKSQSSGSRLYYELWRGETLEKSWFQPTTPYTGDPAKLMLGYEACRWGLVQRYQTNYRLKLFIIERDATFAKVADWKFQTPTLPGVTGEEIREFYRWQDLNMAYLKLPTDSKERQAIEPELAPLRDKASALAAKMNAGMKALSGKSYRLAELQTGLH